MLAKAIIRGAFIVASAAILAACGQNNRYVAPPPPKVVVARPLEKPVTLYMNLTGNTAAFNSVNLVARVQGYLTSIDYKDGATVTKGTQLFGIERDIYQAQLDQANGQLAHDQAALDEAQVNLTRYQTLEQQKSIAAQQAQDQAAVVLQDKGTVLVDQANVETATINLGYTRVLAPFDGTVTNHQVDIGALVGAGGPTTLATIVQSDPLYVYFTASEPQILAIRRNLAKRGQTLRTTNLADIPVEIGLQDEDGYPHKGHMDYVSPQLDASTGTLTGRALFDNKDHTLLPGLFVRVRIPIAREEKALLTRDDAIGTSQEGSYVLVVGADNVVARKIVKTGQRQGQLRIIESGLDPGDWVVTEGVQRAFAGAKVEPQQSDLSSIAGDSSDAVETTVPNPASK
jgi:membrane fusion protein, multidrug efflux system